MNIQESLNRIDEKKRKLDSYRSLPPELVQNLSEWFAIEFTYTSNAIEGNTLSMAETAMVVEKGITVGGKTMREHLEAINHADAIDFIKQLAQKKQSELALDDILAIHKIVLQRIDDRNAGLFRDVMVRIVGSSTVFPNAAKVPFLIVDFMSWLQTVLDHPVITAALAHYKLGTIHPFVDGNGRTARLLMNLLLLQQGYPLAIIKKEKRSEYISAIESARRQENMELFYQVICDAVEYVLDAYLDAAHESNLS